MATTIAQLLILAAACFLISLGAFALLAPARVRAFLLGFAGSPGLHFLELGLRALLAWALLQQAGALPWPRVFALAGWVLLLTTAVMAVLPWRWHRRFAQQAVPRALRFLPLLALAALGMGGFLLFSLATGSVQPGG